MKKVLKFFKGLVNIFNNYYPWSAVIFLALIVIVAYWQIVNLYFWTDDWDLFLKVVHPELGLWGMDPGWFGSGPYRYLHTPFMVMYPLFGFNASGYFAMEIVVYFIATICVFLLALELARKRSLAIGVAAIYASLGYIGSYTIFHLSNLYQNVGAVIFTTLTLWILAKHYRNNNLIYYLLSIFLFYASLEIENLRAHGLIFLVLGLTALYVKWKKSILSIFFNIAKLIPFILIYKSMYSATLSSGNTTTVGAFFHTMGRDRLFAYFINPFASFSNVIIPDNITKFIYGFFGNSSANITPEILLVIVFSLVAMALIIKSKNIVYKYFLGIFILLEVSYFLFNRWALKQSILSNLDISSGFTSMLGMTMLLSFLLISIKLWPLKSNFSKLILFGIILIFGHYIGYFIGIPGYSYLITTDRYLTPSTVGTAFTLGILFYLIRIRKFSLFVMFSSAYCIYLIIIMNFTINTVVNEISEPTKKFYETIKKITPSLPSNSVLYLDFENNPNLRYRVYSSFPNTAFALFYKWNNRVPSLRSFDEYLYNVKINKMKIDDFVSYYISQWDVIETTKSIRNLLKNPIPESLVNTSKWTANTEIIRTESSLFTSPFIFENQKGSVGVNPRLEATINYPSVVPMMLSLTLTSNPTNLEDKRFPYYDVSSQMPDELIKQDLESIDLTSILDRGLPCKDIPYLLELDKERREFIKYAKIDTVSQALSSEKDFLTDGNFETNWSGFILKWNHTKKEEISIDLGQEKEINKLIWVNYLKRTTPSEYNILISTDGKTWTKVKELKNSPSRIDGEFVVDEFAKQSARYVRMVITNTFSNLPPAISEIWVSSIGNTGTIREYVQQVIDSPLYCPINSIEEYRKIMNIIDPFIKAKIWWLTDSYENYNRSFSKDLDIIVDGEAHTYDIYIPAQGTILEQIMISDFQLPLNISVSNASIRSLTFKEIDELGYIRIPEGVSN